jgi:glycolate oxidase FAD binding subunit
VTQNWPDGPNDHFLGDGRYATALDRPESIEALREAVARRAFEGLAIYPQGGGTALEYGGPPSAPGALIHVGALNRVVDYPAADMTITVESGATLASVQRLLAVEGQRLPLDAPQAERATLGGIFASNWSGPHRFGCGRPRDQIIGVRFVSGEAKVVKGGGRVVKNVAGYDLPKLLTGSMGTLGVIVEMTLKVRPHPETTRWVCVGVESANQSAELLGRLNTSATRPTAIELWNRSAANVIAAPAGARDSTWTLAIGFEDNAASVAWQVEAFKSEMIDRDVEVLENDEAVRLWTRLSEFPDAAAGRIAFIANIPPSSVPKFAASLDHARWAVQIHAGNGIVRAFASDEFLVESLAPELSNLRAQAVAEGGNLILSRCPTANKAELRVWGDPRDDAFLARKVKAALDPKGVMNPGRFLGIID